MTQLEHDRDVLEQGKREGMAEFKKDIVIRMWNNNIHDIHLIATSVDMPISEVEHVIRQNS